MPDLATTLPSTDRRPQKGTNHVNALAAGPRDSRGRLRLAGLVVSITLLASCAAQGSPSTSNSPEPSASATASATASPGGGQPPLVINGSIQVAPDRALRVICQGSKGAPTILLEGGGTRSNLQDWPGPFVKQLAQKTTVCQYSRAGGQGSSPIDGLLTRQEIVDDAFALLDILRRDHGVWGPYLIVGGSFGGSVALAEALEHPELMAGLVILDTDFPSDFLAACALSGRSEGECQADYLGDEEAKSIEKDIVARLQPLPDLPVSIVSAMQLPDCSLAPGATSVTADIAGTILTAPNCDALAAAIADKQLADWGQLGPLVAQTRVDASHNVVGGAMSQIIDIILSLLAQST